MRLPREPFSWDGDGDEPVSLNGPVGDADASGELINEAEAVVREAQDAMAREDTDPYMTIPHDVVPPPPSAPGQGRTGSRLMHRVSRRTLALLLTGSCVLAFAHGWTVGSAHAATPCDPAHCHLRDTGNQ